MSDYIITSNASIPSGEVNKIKVNWLAGYVNVIKYDGDELNFNESANRELDENQTMRYKVSNGELKILFSEDGKHLSKLLNNLQKELRIYVPHDIQTLDVDTVSASIDVESIVTENLKLKAVSGSVNALNLSVSEEIKINTVSGSIYIDNISTFNKIDCDSVSGSIKLNNIKAFHNVKCNTVSGSINVQCLERPQDLKCNTVSGRIEVSLPENDGFDAKYSTVSGRMTCEFPCIIEKNRLIYNNGGAELKFNSVSGSINIKKT